MSEDLKRYGKVAMVAGAASVVAAPVSAMVMSSLGVAGDPRIGMAVLAGASAGVGALLMDQML